MTENNTRNYKNIDLSKISYNSLEKYIKLTYYNNSLQFWTPLMFCPFGLEKNYNNYVIKLSFANIINGEKSLNEDFLNFINTFENKNKEHLKVDNENYISQIFTRPKYDPMLILKVPSYNENINIDIINKAGDTMISSDIKKGKMIRVLIEVDNIWDYNNKFTCKFKCSKIIIN